MADTLRRVSYFSTTTPDQPHEGARVLSALRERGVNLLGFHAFPESGRARLDFIPEDEEDFLEAAAEAAIELSEGKTVFCVQGDDRPGVVAEVLTKLGTPTSTSWRRTRSPPAAAATARCSG